MKKILLIIVCLFLVSCTTYKESVRIQLDKFGYEADSTHLVIEKGEPSCVYVYYKYDIPYDKYDQVLKYREHEPTSNHNHKLDILYFWLGYSWVDYYFKSGKFVKKNTSEIKTLVDWGCSN